MKQTPNIEWKIAFQAVSDGGLPACRSFKRQARCLSAESGKMPNIQRLTPKAFGRPVNVQRPTLNGRGAHDWITDRETTRRGAPNWVPGYKGRR